MDFLGFTLSVWSAIALGVFFIAMVVACTADRRHREGPKWAVLGIGAIAFVAWHWWGDTGFSWRSFFGSGFWKAAGFYLGLGVAYSALEFWFQIRREAREWAKAWEGFKKNEADERERARRSESEPLSAAYSRSAPPRPRHEDQPEPSIEERFANKAAGGYGRRYGSHNLTDIALDANKSLVPVVNKQELAEAIGCWTVFWPAYAVSLALGDLLTELCRRLADVFAALSGRFVRRSFAKVFR